MKKFNFLLIIIFNLEHVYYENCNRLKGEKKREEKINEIKYSKRGKPIFVKLYGKYLSKKLSDILTSFILSYC